MKQYRCTRNEPYPLGTQGHEDNSARQGYYVLAENTLDAENQMRQRFTNDTKGFICTVWE